MIAVNITFATLGHPEYAQAAIDRHWRVFTERGDTGGLYRSEDAAQRAASIYRVATVVPPKVQS